MSRRIAFVLLSLFLYACSPHKENPVSAPAASPSAAASLQLPDFSALVEREGPAVVNISTTKIIHPSEQPFEDIPEDDPFYDFFRRFAPPRSPHNIPSKSLGSGFIISHDGYILTNAHVIDDSDEVTVKLTDKREFKAKVIGADKKADIALIKIKGNDLPIVPIGDPGKLKVGEWVLAIGSPFGFENSVTAGIVSAKGRSLPDENYVPFIQTDVAINPGNSGGPLFNLKGEVVGINSQIYSRTGGYMGLSFAIPIDVAVNISNQLKEHGKVSRGRLGVQIQELNADLAKSFGMKDANGALVASVEKDSPAEKAGVKAGDVIVEFNGKAIKNSTELPALVGNTKVGTKTQIKIWRDRSEKTLDIIVGELSSSPAQKSPAKPSFNRLDMIARNLSEEERSDAGHGVMVVETKGASQKAGIEPGDIILAMNHEEISSLEQFNSMLSGLSSGQVIALLVKHGNGRLYIPVKVE